VTKKKATKGGGKKLKLKRQTLKDLDVKRGKKVRGGLAIAVEGDTETIPNACCGGTHTVFTDCEQITCPTVGACGSQAGCLPTFQCAYRV
jgi:hypothetical protein